MRQKFDDLLRRLCPLCGRDGVQDGTRKTKSAGLVQDMLCEKCPGRSLKDHRWSIRPPDSLLAKYPMVRTRRPRTSDGKLLQILALKALGMPTTAVVRQMPHCSPRTVNWIVSWLGHSTASAPEIIDELLKRMAAEFSLSEAEMRDLSFRLWRLAWTAEFWGAGANVLSQLQPILRVLETLRQHGKIPRSELLNAVRAARSMRDIYSTRPRDSESPASKSLLQRIVPPRQLLDA